ncbi:helix-turn-helix transcriptional regulator [Rubinisphaera sp. JC750]|uniref:helix-turn-helix transcriptional regulator n=1 Tax=Rubinisphaera sp. JC750 TaxID=2898658 RepID=UPI0021BC78DE|nr:HTH domain-containing protein [Rubinisphaera sp. JC750]
MQVLHLIAGRGRWDAAALAEELDCSTRTIYRLLQTLSMAGVPWFFDEKTRAYRIRPGYKFPLLDLTPPEQTPASNTDDELQAAKKQLLEDGEALADSLNVFLDVLRNSSSSS